jgi:glutaconate CoA-transferase subunit A
MGLPFMPARGIIGTDYQRVRPDFTVIENPYGGPQDREIALVPALTPGVAVFHAVAADRQGNALVEPQQNVALFAAASRLVICTAERIVEGDLTAAPRTLPLVSGLHVSVVVEAPGGAHPTGATGLYPADAEHIRHYLAAARTEEGFATYLREFVLEPPALTDYLERVGMERLGPAPAVAGGR